MNFRRVVIFLFSLATFPLPHAFAVPSGATITPGSGWSGPTGQPGQVGGGPGSDRRVIAHWDAVPWVTVRTGELFRPGVLAYHINDVNRVEFSVNNGPWVAIDAPSFNPDTRAEEYWVTIDPALFPSSAKYEIRAIAYPNSGVPRVLQTLASDTIESRKDSSLYVNIDKGGLPHDIRYATLSGNDANPCTQAQPCQTLLRALNSVSNLDGAEIRLGEGYWHNGALSTLPAGNPNQWLTITAAPGANPANVKMRGWGTANQYAVPKLIRYYNMTMVDSIVAPLPQINYFWADHVKIIDENPMAMQIFNGCWGPAAQQEGMWYTDIYVDKLCYTPSGTLVRNLDAVETAAGYQADATPTLVNIKFGRIYGSGVLGNPPIDYHGDIVHGFGHGPAGPSIDKGTEDRIIYGMITNPGSAISARGIAVADSSQFDIAIVNTDINFPTYFSFSACGNSANLQVNHFLIENSRFNNGGWCSEGGSVPNWTNYMNNIRIRNTIFENGTAQKMVEPINSAQIRYSPLLGSAQTGLTIISPNGTITKSPNQTTYGSGAQITLQAVPASGYQFRRWGGDLSGTSTSGSITLPTSEAARVKYAYAYFEPIGGPVNVAPQANAGPNQSQPQFPTHAATQQEAEHTRVTMAGSVTDDGFPVLPGRTTLCWTQVSGPTNVAFVNRFNGGTVAKFYSQGTYVLRLTASDFSLDHADEVQITIGGAAPVNQAPQVNAGFDQTINLPSGVNLSGVATDDGLPNPPGAITSLWTKFSGPGTVTFGNASAQATTANFSQAGTYVLRLTANDSALSTSDDVQITVNPIPNQAPQVNAGPNQTIILPTSLVTLSGLVSDDGLPNPPGITTVQWTRTSGPANVIFANAAAAITNVTFSQAGTYVLRLTANDSALSSFDEIQVVVNPPGALNQPPQVSAGSNQTITLPSVANLIGTASDDGLPNPPGTLTYLWAQLSGPGPSQITFPSQLTTTVSFPQDGTYILRLHSYDGEFVVYDDVEVVVNPVPNQAPAVNGGPDRTVLLPGGVNLSAVVTDDGLPNPPGALVQLWIQIGGPGPAQIASPNQLDTSVTFPAPGVYILRIYVYDGALLAEDDVQITVNSPVNQAPQVNAGLDQTGTFPDQINLNATVSDDGLPNPPGLVSVLWSKVSGLGNAVFSNISSMVTSVTFSEAGTYLLRLTANDGQISATDDVQITIEPGPSGFSGSGETRFLPCQDVSNTTQLVNPCIRYELSNDSRVQILIYTRNGKRVATLKDEDQPAGQYSLSWDTGSDVSSGAYKVVLKADGKTLTYNLVVAK